jgi:hypothetical protein
MALKMKEHEKNLLHVDFSHLTDFPHEDPEFMKNLVSYYYRYEPDLRQAVTKFINA